MRYLIAALSLIVVTCSQAQPQTPREVLHQAQRSNWIIRVIVGPDSIGPGRIRTITADSAIIGSSNIALSAIIQIDRLTRVGSGGAELALAGAVGMGLVGLGFIGGFCSGECSPLQLVGGAAMGATLGATLGGLFGGAAIPGRREWMRLWPHE